VEKVEEEEVEEVEEVTEPVLMGSDLPTRWRAAAWAAVSQGRCEGNG
jgi:hypothetical protein